MLGGILLLLLLLIALVFYHTGKPIALQLSDLRGQYRTALTAWLQGQAELRIVVDVNEFCNRLDTIEYYWQHRQ